MLIFSSCGFVLFTTVIFQQIYPKPTKFKKVFAMSKRKCTGRIVSTHLTGRFCASCSWFLVGPLVQCAGAFGSFLLPGTAAEEYFSNIFDKY